MTRWKRSREGVSAAWKKVDKLIGSAKGPKRREWGTIGELEILVGSDGTVVLCKGYREHGASLEHPWLELTRDELCALLARGDDLLRAGRKRSRDAGSNALNLRRPRFVLRVGDQAFPFLRNVEKAEASARLVDYVEEARTGPIVVTIRGRPVAFLATVQGSDLEDLSIGTDPGFLEVLRRSRENHRTRGGASIEDMWSQVAHRRQAERPRNGQR